MHAFTNRTRPARSRNRAARAMRSSAISSSVLHGSSSVDESVLCQRGCSRHAVALQCETRLSVAAAHLASVGHTYRLPPNLVPRARRCASSLSRSYRSSSSNDARVTYSSLPTNSVSPCLLYCKEDDERRQAWRGQAYLGDGRLRLHWCAARAAWRHSSGVLRSAAARGCVPGSSTSRSRLAGSHTVVLLVEAGYQVTIVVRARAARPPSAASDAPIRRTTYPTASRPA